MASLITADQMTATTKRHFSLGAITEQIYDETVILNRMKGNIVTIAGGTKIQHPIRALELGDFATIDPDAGRVTATYVTRTYLELDWKYAKVDIAMTLEERTQNQGEAQIVNLMKDKYTEAMQDIKEGLADGFFKAYTSTGTNDFTGFYSAVRAVDTSYGGIDSTTVTSWDAGLYDTSTTTLALYGTGSIDAGLQACYFRGRPNLMATTVALASIYAAKLQPGERREPENGRAGATDLYFAGIPIIVDTHVPAGDWIFLSTDDMVMFANPLGNMDVEAWENDPDHYKMLRQLIMFIGNYGFLRRKTLGAYTAITS
jgi:hypothetical protein